MKLKKQVNKLKKIYKKTKNDINKKAWKRKINEYMKKIAKAKIVKWKKYIKDADEKVYDKLNDILLIYQH